MVHQDSDAEIHQPRHLRHNSGRFRFPREHFDPRVIPACRVIGGDGADFLGAIRAGAAGVRHRWLTQQTHQTLILQQIRQIRQNTVRLWLNLFPFPGDRRVDPFPTGDQTILVSEFKVKTYELCLEFLKKKIFSF